MLAYASRTGTRRNLAVLRRAGWRLLVSASACLRTEGFRYALDNGAWSAFQQGRPFDATRFLVALKTLGGAADWTVIPDIVAGGYTSLALSRDWLPQVLAWCPYALLAVQDGLTPDDVVPYLGERVGLFVGGSTVWKWQTVSLWGHVAREVGCWLHVGRVNTAQAIARCAMAGATSFDGTSVSRYACTLPPLDKARKQLAFAI